MPVAVVTGASSGIGREIAAELADRGYDLILAARRTERLLELANTLPAKAGCVKADLSKAEDCLKLYNLCKDKDIEILVNNAGFGDFGEFVKSDLARDMEMVDVNIRAVHILSKLFLKDFVNKDKGKILNVASAAGFLPAGPLLGTYYGTKAYVLSLTRAIAKELKMSGSKVTITALCPGPVKTEFDSVAGVDFAGVGISAKKAASEGVKGLLKGKKIVVPGKIMNLGCRLSKLVPDSILIAFAYRFQRAKKD